MTISVSSVGKQLSWSGGGQSLCTRVEKTEAVSSRSTYLMVSWSPYPYRNSAYIWQNTRAGVFLAARYCTAQTATRRGPGACRPRSEGRGGRGASRGDGWQPGHQGRRQGGCLRAVALGGRFPLGGLGCSLSHGWGGAGEGGRRAATPSLLRGGCQRET